MGMKNRPQACTDVSSFNITASSARPSSREPSRSKGAEKVAFQDRWIHYICQQGNGEGTKRVRFAPSPKLPLLSEDFGMGSTVGIAFSPW